ncbi:nucleotide exchange factor GrpE [Desulfobacter vibrioformis]|uniref:nucleotide exchange factor GrpE n=1 Tax=Desulfobacter vibrioformis TaxID=34031 RepID=UPI00055413AD|nr:nucleotide exchange factor GrpE [Desulfobacter vibrioformis]
MEKSSDREKRTGNWFKKTAFSFTKMKGVIIQRCKTVLKGYSRVSWDDEDEISEDRTALETGGMQPWKTKVLEDFKTWLSEVPDQDPPALSVTPDTCDLYTLLSEFTALKQEIKMQNREQHRTLKALDQITAMTDAYGEIMDHFNEKTRQIADLEQNIRMETEKRTVSYFFDIRDSLVRGRAACPASVSQKGFFRRAPKNMDNIRDGYDMAIRKFDASLALLGIHPIASTGAVFDPMAMRALESRTTEGVEKGTVVETVSGGFKRGNEILRYAQVVVAD